LPFTSLYTCTQEYRDVICLQSKDVYHELGVLTSLAQANIIRRMSTDVSRARSARKQRGDEPVQGLPAVNYRVPIIATLLATVMILLVASVLTAFALFNMVTQWNRASTNQPGSSAVTVGICGCLSLILLAT